MSHMLLFIRLGLRPVVDVYEVHFWADRKKEKKANRYDEEERCQEEES